MDTTEETLAKETLELEETLELIKNNFQETRDTTEEIRDYPPSSEIDIINLLSYYVKNHINSAVIDILDKYSKSYNIRQILYFVSLDAINFDNILLLERLDNAFIFDTGLKNTIILHYLKECIPFYTLEYIIILLKYYTWDKYIVDRIFYNHRMGLLSDNNVYILFQSYYEGIIPITNEVHLFLNTCTNDFLPIMIRSRITTENSRVISIYHKKFDKTVERLLLEHLNDLGMTIINNRDINLQSQRKLCYHMRGKASKLR